MKSCILCSLCFFAVIMLIGGCNENINDPKSDLPENFYKKVSANLQPTLINLFDEIKLGTKSYTELSNEYNSTIMPVDTLLRVLVVIRPLDQSVKNELDVLNCELKNEGDFDLYYWVPVIHFLEVVEIEKVLSILPKGISVTN